MTWRKPQARQAFTLLEVLIVVAIIAGVLALSIPLYSRWVARAKSTEALTNMGEIRRAETLYRLEHDRFAEALDLPAINAALELDLSARHFDYEITDADESQFLIVATSRGAGSPLRVTMNRQGQISYQWPTATGGTGAGGGGWGGGGGGGGSSGGGDGGSSGGGSGGEGSDEGGGSDGGSTEGDDSGDSDDGSTEGDDSGDSDDPGGVGPEDPDLATFLSDTFGVLLTDGALAVELAGFITDNGIQLVLEDLPYADDCSGGTGGTIGPSESWWQPQPGTSQIIINKKLVACGWTATEAAPIMAHEADHIRQVFAGLFLDASDMSVLWLEDVEGPAYVTETLVWDSLRRDAEGNVVLTTDKNDTDERADLYILPDGSVDTAAHNAFISQSRGIPANCPFFDQDSC